MLRRGWPCIFLVVSIYVLLSAGLSSAGNSENRLTLEDSIEIALKSSTSLRVAQEGVREAEARTKEAKSAFFPKVSTSYSYTRLNPAPYLNFPGFPPVVPAGTIITGTKDNYNWAVELRQPLFAGGGITAGYELGRLAEDTSRTNEATVKSDLIREVKEAYFRILKAEKILLVADQTQARLAGHRDEARSFYELGLIPRNDFLAAEVEVANAKQFLLRAKSSLEIAKSALNTLLRRDINSPLEVQDVLVYTPFLKTWEECLTIALTKRTEIQTANLRVEQARKGTEQVKSEFYPYVNLIGNYSRYGDDPGVEGSAFKGQETWYVTLVAHWNLWEGGRTTSRMDASRSRERQAIDAAANIRDRIVLDVKNAYLFVKEAEQQIATAKEAVGQAEENFRITRERYTEQVGRATEVIDAQTILTRAQSDYYNALSEYHIQQAILDRAMGL